VDTMNGKEHSVIEMPTRLIKQKKQKKRDGGNTSLIIGRDVGHEEALATSLLGKYTSKGIKVSPLKEV